MSPPFRRREAAWWLAVVALGLGLLFAGPLFGDRCTLSMQPDDPRLGMRPWAQGDPRDLGPVNPITPDIDAFVLPGLLRARQLLDDEGAAYRDDRQLLGYALAANMPWPLDGPLTFLAPRLAERFMVQPIDAVDLLDAMLALHLGLALFLAYRLCRKLGCAAPFAAAGAIGFAFSTWMSTRWHAPHIVYTTAFWPAQAAALLSMRRGFVRRGMVEGALATAFLLLSGFPQVGMILTGGTILLAFADGELRRPRRLIALVLMLALGVGLAAPQLLINQDSYSRSLRADPEVQAANAARGLPAASLLGALLPQAFGHPPDFSLPGAPAPTMESWLPQRLWWSQDIQNSVVENALYPGLLVLLVLPLLLRRRTAGEPAGDAPAWGAPLLGIAGLAVLGAVLAPAVVERLPALERLAAGNVKRALVLVGACLPVAAALALQRLGGGRGAPPWRWAALLALACIAAPLFAATLPDPDAPAWAAALGGQGLRQLGLLGAALLALLLLWRLGRWLPGGASDADPPAEQPGFATAPTARHLLAWRHRDLCFAARLVAWAPAAILALDLVPLALAFNPFPRQVEAFPSTPGLELLAARTGRVAVFGTDVAVLPPSAAALHGIRSLHGVAPMIPTRTAEFLGCIEGPLLDLRDPRVVQPLARAESLSHPLLDLLGVDTIVHADPGLAAATGWTELFAHPAEAMAALERPGAGPRAFWTGGARVVPDAAARLALLADRAFPVHETALLEESPTRALPERSPQPAVAAVLTHASSHRVELVVDAPAPGLVVLTEAWDPGFSATVDGQPAPVHVVDHALLGVEVDAGRREVVFSYAPPQRRTGLFLAGGALGGLLLLYFTVLRDGLRRRTTTTTTTTTASSSSSSSSSSSFRAPAGISSAGPEAGDGAAKPPQGPRSGPEDKRAEPSPASGPAGAPLVASDNPWSWLPAGVEPPGMPRVASDLGEFEGQAVSIIIPAYDDTPQLRRAIWSIRRTADLPFQLIVARCKQSVAKNRNLGLAQARCDLIFFMDDDVLLPPGWTSRMVALLAARKDLGAVSAHLMFSDGSPQTRRPDLLPGQFWEITIPGTCFGLSRQRVTGAFFDENYLGSQWEDTDFMWQLHAMGLKTGVTGDVCVVHDHNDAENKWLKPNAEYFRGKWQRWPGEDETFSISPEAYAAWTAPPLPGAGPGGQPAAPREWDTRAGRDEGPAGAAPS